MTTTELDAVMQAAERLRRVRNGERRLDVYGVEANQFWLADGAWHRDRHNLADFALSILPKGKRPVPIDRNGPYTTGWLAYAGEVEKAERIDGAWHVVHEVEGLNGTSVLKFDAYGDIYGSADDARAELHWRRLEQLQAASS